MSALAPPPTHHDGPTSAEVDTGQLTIRIDHELMPDDVPRVLDMVRRSVSPTTHVVTAVVTGHDPVDHCELVALRELCRALVQQGVGFDVHAPSPIARQLLELAGVTARAMDMAAIQPAAAWRPIKVPVGAAPSEDAL